MQLPITEIETVAVADRPNVSVTVHGNVAGGVKSCSTLIVRSNFGCVGSAEPGPELGSGVRASIPRLGPASHETISGPPSGRVGAGSDTDWARLFPRTSKWTWLAERDRYIAAWPAELPPPMITASVLLQKRDSISVAA